MSLERALELLRAMPEVEEKPAHGIPTFRVKGRLFVAIREALGALVIKLDFETRDMLIEGRPEIFSTNDHYRGYPMVIVNLRKVPVALLRELLEDAWRRAAPAKLAAAHPEPASWWR